MTNSTEHMWIADFVRAGSRHAAFEVIQTKTLELVTDESVLGLLGLADTDRGSAIAIERALTFDGLDFLAWAWKSYAVDGGEPLAEVARQGLDIVNSARMPLATVSHCIAHLRVWGKLTRAKRTPEFKIDVFAASAMNWRGELARIAEDDVRARKAFAPPVSLLWSRQWDEAALILGKATIEFLDPLDAPLVPSADELLTSDRGTLRNNMRSLVKLLFDVGTTDSGELAIGWLMLLCDPMAPSSFQHVVPQLQLLFDGAFLSDENRKSGQALLNTWWDGAAGKHVNSKVSAFAIAANAIKRSGGTGFEAARRTASLDPVIEKSKRPAVPGRSVVVMPLALGSKLNNYHEMFKPLVDEALPLVIVKDLARIRSTLHAEYPHATVAVDQILRDLREDRPFYVKPVILVGSPGSGKSRLVRRLCDLVSARSATALSCYRFDASSSHDNMFGGVSKAWGNTEASVPARAVAQSMSASPLVLIDEIEKAGVHWQAGGLHSALLPFTEIESAKRFRDPSLDWQLDLSHVSYCATANDVDRLPAPLRDRFRIIKVPDPSIDHLPALASNVMREIAVDDELRAHDEPLAGDEIEVIGRAWKRAGMSMRMLQKIVAATLEARDMHARRH